WTLLAARQGKPDTPLRPVGLVAAGTRVFDAGVEGDIEKGREKSRAVQRREARLARRGTDRRARRMHLVYSILERAGLLPSLDPPSNSSEGNSRGIREQESQLRHETLVTLDRELAEKWREKLRSEGADKDKLRQINHTIPYILRARALDEKLEPYEVGRAIYHLAQRRGFLSNRKSPLKKDEDLGKVKGDINKLQEKIEETGSRTLGEYFSKLDPEEERIRQRWTGRKMYEEEFGKIWAVQQKHHPNILTEDLKKQLIGSKRHPAIFYQRPLKSQKHLIGKCELEKDRRRAPMAILDFQRFRMIQMLNDTRVITPMGELREMTAEEREKLLAELDIKGDLTFAKAKKVLGLSREHHFNWEGGIEKRIIGNRTAAKLVEIFGIERWKGFSEEERNRIIEDVLSIQKEDTLFRRGINAWGLDEESAKKFSELQLKPDYARFSRRALKKLLPLMQQGIPYKTAEKQVYGDRLAADAHASLPAVADVLPELRNPIVNRTLNELRKVVNAVIRKYGKPALIRIELARDLRNSAKQRKNIMKKIEDNRKAREKAAEGILKEMPHFGEPKRADREKWLLADECNWECPYTGRQISVSALFGENPQFDVEHIIPFSRSLDDSFLNKTICEIAENRNVKRNYTPYEAYGRDEEKWNQILHRVKNFRGRAGNLKLERFQVKEAKFEDFASQQLNDTRYASKLAKKYLGLLYGKDAAKHVQAGRGGVTKFIRDELCLNAILGDGGDEKKRTDHRHHAVDAIAIALTSPGVVKMLSDAARYNEEKGLRRRFGNIKSPWPGFFEDVRKAVENIVASHRVSRRVNGPLHEETNYSPIKKDENGRDCVHIRKPVESLDKKNLKDIVDPVVRERVREWMEQANEHRPYPVHKTKDGREIPIKKVRIRKYDKPMTIGRDHRSRNVLSGSNHHLDIFEVTDKKGRPKWEGRLVSAFEAMQLKRQGKSVYSRERKEGGKFLFSLSQGEIIELDEKDGNRGLYRVRILSQLNQRGIKYPRVSYVRINDARLKADILKAKEWNTKLLEPLRKLNCRKVTITPLGEVRRAND
ncbi:MAG: type II CRISPR RNA-guided endonuclease Cas9, partial [Planctomycetota bacterium]